MLYRYQFLHHLDCLPPTPENFLPTPLLTEEANAHSRTPSLQSYTGSDTTIIFKGFSNFVGQISTRWKTLFLTVLNSELPYHVFFYENLLQDPIGETRKIIKFFEANNGFQLPNLEERLLCVQENLQGTQKRKTRKLSRDPYSKEMVVKINADIFFVRQFIASHNIPLVLPLYERN